MFFIVMAGEYGINIAEAVVLRALVEIFRRSIFVLMILCVSMIGLLHSRKVL